MNVLGKFNEGKQIAVRSTVYVTGEGKGNLLSYETAMQLRCVPEISEVNEMAEISPVKITVRYSKLCEEYNDMCQGTDTLKCVQVKIHIDETVQSVQDRHRIIPYHIRENVQEELNQNRSNLTSYRKWWTLQPRG